MWATPNLDFLQKAVDDHERRPWRYYKLDAETLKQFCDQLSDKVAALETRKGAFMRPTISRIVHYVAYGTPGGEYMPGAHRAAIITTVSVSETSVKDPAARIGICIINPTGLFFAQDVQYDPTGLQPGTWHWPEREQE
jgi:hypothetical protein